MYKEASKLKLRFNTEKGMLTVEQLWDCSRNLLVRTLKNVNNALKESAPIEDLDFLDESVVVKTVDVENRLRFNILKDIYLAKVNEANEIRDAAAIKAHNAKIDSIIARKEDDKLESLSTEELAKMRK